MSWRVDAVLRQRWLEVAWLSAALFNAQPGRKRPVKPRQLNPYQGLWPAPTDREDDLDDIFGITD